MVSPSRTLPYIIYQTYLLLYPTHFSYKKTLHLVLVFLPTPIPYTRLFHTPGETCPQPLLRVSCTTILFKLDRISNSTKNTQINQYCILMIDNC